MSLKGRGKREEQVSSWAQACLSCFSEARAYKCKCDGFKWPDVFLLQAPRHFSSLGQVPWQPRGGTATGVGVGGSRPRRGQESRLEPSLGRAQRKQGSSSKGESQGRGSREMQPVRPPTQQEWRTESRTKGLELRAWAWICASLAWCQVSFSLCTLPSKRESSLRRLWALP